MACDHGSPKFFYSTMSDTGLRGGSQNQMSARDVLPDTVIQFQSVVTNSFFFKVCRSWSSCYNSKLVLSVSLRRHSNGIKSNNVLEVGY